MIIENSEIGYSRDRELVFVWRGLWIRCSGVRALRLLVDHRPRRSGYECPLGGSVLGAQGGDVLGLVMKQGALTVLIGLTAGLITALLLTRLMASLLFAIAPTDAATFASVTAVLAVVALAACYVPARRATRVDPENDGSRKPKTPFTVTRP
jgi:hypothetical protein